MPPVDMSLEELRTYKPAVSAQHDFNAFWKRNLENLRREPLSVNLSVRPMPFKNFDVYDVNFLGAGDALINGELIVPHGAKGLPGIIIHHGYSTRRPFISEVMHWAAMGAVVLTVDVRGQMGRSGDNAAYPGTSTPGFMTAGIEDPNTYYYRNVYLDGVRAVDVLAGREEVDKDRMAVYGISQGGGISLAMAALDPRIALCMAEVPFLCDYPRAVWISGQYPYQEIGAYCRFLNQEQITRAFRTLSYFDNVNLAGRNSARTILSVGLSDATCPPSSIFAVYNHLAGEKQIQVYPYMGHDSNGYFVELCMQEMARQFNI